MQRMNKMSARLATFQKKALCLAVAAAFSQAALANPLNPTVAAGSATFATNGNTLTVTNTPNAIINWQKFNIGQNETTRFIQQSAQSAVLNRINDQNASQILGTLTSNGRVFLVNPNGVMFGQGSVIDVAGLIASSLNLSNADFLAGKLKFDGGGFGAVTNLGNISTPLGGSVYLIGNNVENKGVITTPQGQVILAAGSSVSLIDTGGPELSVTLTASGNKAVNIGTINSQGGRIDMFGAIIEQQGILRANEATVDDAGRIVLKATDKVTVSGEISATGQVGAGGTVQVLGNDVTLTSTSKINVSGASGGGTALIGGDYQGKNAAVQNALNTTIEQGATITADALNNGKGGRVIVWADDKTVFDGFIAARGGANGGDGGFVEVSGHNMLNFGRGSVNTLAPAGKVGRLLLDPLSFCVYGTDALTECTGTYAATSPISTSQLDSMMAYGDVSLQASDYFAYLPNGGTYTVSSNGNNRVIDIYSSHIYINGTLDGSATNITGIFSATYGGGTAPSGKQGVIDIGAGARFLTTGGSVEFTASNAINFSGSAVVSTSGSYTNSSPYGGSVAYGGTMEYEGLSLVRMSAPTITKTDNGSGYIAAPRVGVHANLLTGVNTSITSPDIRTDGLGVMPHGGIVGAAGADKNIYLGTSNASANCYGGGGFALCITNQLENVTSLTAGIPPKVRFEATTDNGATFGNIVIDPNYVDLPFGNQKYVASVFTLQTNNTYVAPASSYSGYGSNVYAGVINMDGDLNFQTNSINRNFGLYASSSYGGPQGIINLKAWGNGLHTGGSVSLNADEVRVTPPMGDTNDYEIWASGSIAVNAPIVSYGGALNLTAGSNISIGSASFRTVNDSNYGGGLELFAGNNVTLNGSLTSTYPRQQSNNDTSNALKIKAGNAIYRGSNTISWGQYGGGIGPWSEVYLKAPTIYGSGVITTGYLSLMADNLSNFSSAIHVKDVDVITYGSATDMYFGPTNTSVCSGYGGTALCFNHQFSVAGTTISGEFFAYSGKDLYFQSGSWGIPVSPTIPYQKSFAARGNIIIQSPLSPYTSNHYGGMAMVAGTGFDNQYGSGAIWDVATSWVLISPNASSTKLNGLLATTSTTTLPSAIPDAWSSEPWVDIGAGWGDFIDDLRTQAVGKNIAFYYNETTTNQNVTNQVTTVTEAQEVLQDTVTATTTDPNATAQGTLTVSADLKVADNTITKKTETRAEQDDKGTGAKGELKVKGKTEEEKKKEAAAAARQRQEQRAAEEKKTPAELKREAQTLKAEAKKAEGEAKKSEGEAKKSEGEARKLEGEHKKAEGEHRKAEAEAKKAEETGKKAEVEAKKHDADAKQADTEVKNAKTPVAKANAESKKADAESKKADAESKKVEAAEKKSASEGKKSEAESKKAETESKQKDAETKKVEAESKKAESESKQAEAEAKLALAEAKEAKTPQQKQAAERRAEEKRVEAVQKKAEAAVKKDQAEAKKAEVEAKKAESEAKKAESEHKKVEAESKRAEGESKKSESNAKKAESEGKKAEADSAKAKQEGKGGDEKKAEGKKQEAEKQKAQEEKKSEGKQKEAEAKQKEAEGKKKDAEAKQKVAEAKQKEAEKKREERREETRKSFAKASVAAMGIDRAAQMVALRHEFKTETLKPALNILERNPAAANLPTCSGGNTVCVPAQTNAQQIAQIASQLPTPRVPTVSFLPQIQRKIAVVLAINDYKDGAIPPLESAVPDGEAIGKLMGDRLGYDVRVVRNASRADIVSSLNKVSSEVGPNDSVTVYYAGHGYQMPDKAGKPGEGYWIPADASAKDPSNWVSNSDVSKLLGAIPAKQVMLVSDSCYSGAFTKEQKVTTASNDPKQLLANRSVTVMSSGGEEPVSDEGKDGHSIFAWSLMETLKGVDKFDTGNKLFEGIRKTVTEEFPQVPQYGAAGSAGHVTGGDYLIESRKY